MVSYCVCWPDASNRVGLFEPVGTRPAAARRGFGRAVVLEAFRRLREKDMRTAIVGTGTVNRPATALYASAGFDIVLDRMHAYVKADA
jgi:mycothiol synthase